MITWAGKYYLLVDYPTSKIQRARIVPVGAIYVTIKQFTSRQDKAESRARSYCKKHKIDIS